MKIVKRVFVAALLVAAMMSLSGCLAEMLTAYGKAQQAQYKYGF